MARIKRLLAVDRVHLAQKIEQGIGFCEATIIRERAVFRSDAN